MFWSGFTIGSVLTRVARVETLLGQARANCASSVAAPGAAIRGASGLRTGSGAAPRTGAITSGSVAPREWSERFTDLPIYRFTDLLTDQRAVEF
jgi:hypothetical protein